MMIMMMKMIMTRYIWVEKWLNIWSNVYNKRNESYTMQKKKKINKQQVKWMAS